MEPSQILIISILKPQWWFISFFQNLEKIKLQIQQLLLKWDFFMLEGGDEEFFLCEYAIE